jgi:DNA modification methylase
LGISEYFSFNSIYCGDCQEVLSKFPTGSIDLIYADPPFFSNKRYEVIWGDGYEIHAFEDRWKGGIENYIAWMDPKLRECHRVLKPTGSMYLHCDWHANAHLRVLMDRIFGEDRFQREIIWDTKVLSGFKAQARNWIRGHDTIFFYSKGVRFTFNKLMVPHREEYLERFNKSDDKGRKYFDGRGKRRYLDDVIKKGKAIGDVWSDIMSFQQIPTAKERLGYPTQKPVALLERIVAVSSNSTDAVLDPFCGCGTAIAAAQKLGRRWIGIDVSPSACKLMVRRMSALGVPIAEQNIIGLPMTLEELKVMEPFEFQKWVLQKLGGRVNPRMVGDRGIDGWLGEKPVQVKRWGHTVGRPEIDKFETALRREKKKEGLVVAFEFGKLANEEVARVKNSKEESLNITLVTVKELIGAD